MNNTTFIVKERNPEYLSVMWVVKDGCQVYPEYLITYKQKILSEEHKNTSQSDSDGEEEKKNEK